MQLHPHDEIKCNTMSVTDKQVDFGGKINKKSPANANGYAQQTLPLSYFARSFGVTTFEFMENLYGS